MLQTSFPAGVQNRRSLPHRRLLDDQVLVPPSLLLELLKATAVVEGRLRSPFRGWHQTRPLVPRHTSHPILKPVSSLRSLRPSGVADDAWSPIIEHRLTYCQPLISLDKITSASKPAICRKALQSLVRLRATLHVSCIHLSDLGSRAPVLIPPTW